MKNLSTLKKLCKLTGAIAMFLAFSANASAQGKTWDGGGSTNNWSEAANWVGDVAPTTGDDVLFDATSSKNCTINASLGLNSLTIAGYTGTISVQSATPRHRVVVNSWTQSSGTVLLKDGDSAHIINTLTQTAGLIGTPTPGIRIGNYVGSRPGAPTSGFMCEENSNVFFGNLTVSGGSSGVDFRCPNNGNLTLTGNLTILSEAFQWALCRRCIFTGSGAQNVTTGRIQDMQGPIIRVLKQDKEHVYLQSSIGVTALVDLDGGNIVTGSNNLVLKNGAQIKDGSKTYVNGNVKIERTVAFGGANNFYVPVGIGSDKRVVWIKNTNTTNNWTIRYVKSDPVTTFPTITPLSPIGAISTDGFWEIIAGANHTNTEILISSAGKGSFDATKLHAAISDGTNWVVNSQKGSLAWGTTNWGTSRSYNTGTYHLVLAERDATPSPIDMIFGDRMSGEELELTQSTTNQVQTAGDRAGITFVAFPSPVTETLNLELNGAAQGIITLSDLSGKVIGTYPATTRKIDMRNVANGMYFVTFSDGVNRIAQRVVRQ